MWRTYIKSRRPVAVLGAGLALALGLLGVTAAAAATMASTTAMVAAPAMATASAGAAAPAVAANAAAAAAPERTVLANPGREVRDFALTDAAGKTVHLSQFQGAPVLVFFGFAHCPTVCPMALTKLRALEKDHARELGGTRVVVISVDGERDTPSMLAEWLTPISPNFIGLTGPTRVVNDIASQFSAAFFKGASQPSGEYLVEHSSQIFLLDAAGRLRATFYDAPIETLASVTQTIAAEPR